MHTREQNTCNRAGSTLFSNSKKATMPSNIWLFDINSSPTSSTTNLSHAHVTITAPVTSSPSDPADVSRDGPADGTWPALPASTKSQRTRNPIRAIVDPIVASAGKTHREDGKELISLALGDPTVHNNFPPCKVAVNALKAALDSPSMAAGYVNACGTTEARDAIASYHSCPEVQLVIDPDDVVVAGGCSGALELAITALLDEGSVLLVPRPGFPIYQVIAESHGARVAYYDLDPDNNWECNLQHIEQVINSIERQHILSSSSLPFKDSPSSRIVRGIVINNPSNPTGSVYSCTHLSEILRLAERHRLPIIADEIYGDLTYGEALFRPLANVASSVRSQVPIITASGLGKQYLVPGWRVGWLVFHDNATCSLKQVKDGAKRLAQVVLGASHLVQKAVPAVLAPPSLADHKAVAEFRSEVRTIFSAQASLTFEKLRACPGLTVTAPQGAMYLMAQINCSLFDDAIDDDLVFTKLLLEEENVFVLPGRAFGATTDLFRVCFGAPADMLDEAFVRIHAFCQRHYVGERTY